MDEITKKVIGVAGSATNEGLQKVEIVNISDLGIGAGSGGFIGVFDNASIPTTGEPGQWIINSDTGTIWQYNEVTSVFEDTGFTLDITLDTTGLEKDHIEDLLTGDVILTTSTGSSTTILNKTKVLSLINDIETADLTNYYTKVEQDLTDEKQDLLIAAKVDSAVFDSSQTAQNALIDIKVDTSTFENSQEIQNYRIANVEEDLTDLQLMMNSVILEKINTGPVPLSTTPVSILTFPEVVNAGKYNGAIRATWNGTGLRTVTLTIYINGVATSRTSTESYTDNQTTSLFTTIPLELVEGDIVEVYASSTTGSVEAISGAIQLVLSNGTIDLSAYETVADHTEDMTLLRKEIDAVKVKIAVVEVPCSIVAPTDDTYGAGTIKKDDIGIISVINNVISLPIGVYRIKVYLQSGTTETPNTPSVVVLQPYVTDGSKAIGASYNTFTYIKTDEYGWIGSGGFAEMLLDVPVEGGGVTINRFWSEQSITGATVVYVIEKIG